MLQIRPCAVPVARARPKAKAQAQPSPGKAQLQIIIFNKLLPAILFRLFSIQAGHIVSRAQSECVHVMDSPSVSNWFIPLR